MSVDVITRAELQPVVRVEPTARRLRVLNGAAFTCLKGKRLVETTADDLRRVLAMGGAAVNLTQRCMHNLALGLGWLPAAIKILRTFRGPPFPAMGATWRFKAMMANYFRVMPTARMMCSCMIGKRD